MRKLIFTATFTLLVSPALAFVSIVTPQGGQTSPGEGLVSANGALTAEERFNSAAQPSTCARQDPLGITILGQQGVDYNLANDSLHYRRSLPNGDNSCYLAIGAQSPASTIALEFSNASASSPLTYLGFYWGSMDEYNWISFLDASNNPVPFFSSTGDFAVTGEQVAGVLGYPAYVYGSSPYPSAFVEFTFSAADNVKQAVLSTTDYAFELDNIGYVLQATSAPQARQAFVATPEPPALALSGFGCLLLAYRGRRASSKGVALRA